MDGSRDYYDVYFLWRPSDSWLTFQCCKGACQFLTVQGLTAGVRPAITLAYQLRQSLLQYDQQPLLASEGEKGIDSLPSKELALCKRLVTSMLFWNCAETFPSAVSAHTKQVYLLYHNFCHLPKQEGNNVIWLYYSAGQANLAPDYDI